MSAGTASLSRRYPWRVSTGALGIAEATSARLTLLRIVEKEPKKTEAENYVQALAARFQAEGRTIPSSGKVFRDILEEANRVPGTLVAITSHGRGGILTAMLGSVAREIVRASHNPVLVFRPDGKSHDLDPIRITTVLLPLDGSSLSESVETRIRHPSGLGGALWRPC